MGVVDGRWWMLGDDNGWMGMRVWNAKNWFNAAGNKHWREKPV